MGGAAGRAPCKGGLVSRRPASVGPTFGIPGANSSFSACADAAQNGDITEAATASRSGPTQLPLAHKNRIGSPRGPLRDMEAPLPLADTRLDDQAPQNSVQEASPAPDERSREEPPPPSPVTMERRAHDEPMSPLADVRMGAGRQLIGDVTDDFFITDAPFAKAAGISSSFVRSASATATGAFERRQSLPPPPRSPVPPPPPCPLAPGQPNSRGLARWSGIGLEAGLMPLPSRHVAAKDAFGEFPAVTALASREVLLRIVGSLQAEKAAMDAQVQAISAERDRLEAECRRLLSANLEKDQQLALLLAQGPQAAGDDRSFD
mmetsp:Transcript_101211/g.285322  ORF Transcript_101211/g.285322 Transcript_101211/m.285322 type:complete len:320 (+) Transcript_101211:1-960(+)